MTGDFFVLFEKFLFTQVMKTLSFIVFSLWHIYFDPFLIFV